MSHDAGKALDHLFPPDWLQTIVQRHPYAVAQRNYLFTRRHAPDLQHPNHADDGLLVILEDCVVICRTPDGHEGGVCTHAGTLWFQPQGVTFVRLDPYNGDYYPDQHG